MLFGKNDSPFKDNDICKRCINKPCRFLLAGHLYPGRVTFLCRSELYLYPCYSPSWVRNKDESAGEPAALTDDLEIIQGNVEISNPVWQHKDEELKESSPDFAAEEDTIHLSANVKNFPQGASVTFDVRGRHIITVTFLLVFRPAFFVTCLKHSFSAMLPRKCLEIRNEIMRINL